jgi:hypothetical protein
LASQQIHTIGGSSGAYTATAVSGKYGAELG